MHIFCCRAGNFCINKPHIDISYVIAIWKLGRPKYCTMSNLYVLVLRRWRQTWRWHWYDGRQRSFSNRRRRRDVKEIKAETIPNDLHQLPAGRARTRFPTHPLPGRLHTVISRRLGRIKLYANRQIKPGLPIAGFHLFQVIFLNNSNQHTCTKYQ